LQTWEEDFDFWKSAVSGFSADILVEPGQIETLANQLKVGKSKKYFHFFPNFKKRVTKPVSLNFLKVSQLQKRMAICF
jgi:hypothetical protein